MIIDGKSLAQKILESLKKRIDNLKEKEIIPHLAVILIGDNPSSRAYIRQKELKAQEIGAKITIYQIPTNTPTDKVVKLVSDLNNLSTAHGVVVQKPFPPSLNTKAILQATNPQKDIDGFLPLSPYPVPLAKAVIEILKYVFRLKNPKVNKQENFNQWLSQKKIVIIGKGETGGKPVIEMFKKMGIEPHIIDSQTEHPESITKKADIVISAVGKPGTIKSEMLKKNVILLSIGLSKGEDGKTQGDYEENEIKNIASFYTPTPGGVGPVNVAMLLENLVTSAERQAT